MALQKYKVSKSRTRKRRNSIKLSSIGSSTCPQCGKVKIPHRVCEHCGFYRDKKVV